MHIRGAPRFLAPIYYVNSHGESIPLLRPRPAPWLRPRCAAAEPWLRPSGAASGDDATEVVGSACSDAPIGCGLASGELASSDKLSDQAASDAAAADQGELAASGELTDQAASDKPSDQAASEGAAANQDKLDDQAATGGLADQTVSDKLGNEAVSDTPAVPGASGELADQATGGLANQATGKLADQAISDTVAASSVEGTTTEWDGSQESHRPRPRPRRRRGKAEPIDERVRKLGKFAERVRSLSSEMRRSLNSSAQQ